MYRLVAGLAMLAAPVLIIGGAVYLVLAWLGIVDGEVSGWAVIAGLVGAAGIIAQIAED